MHTLHSMMSPHGVGAWQQWRSQSFAITGADGGRGHVLLQVNFDPSFEYLGLIFAAVVDEAKNRR